jgi:NADH-quinone oxidoreductase subunit L
MGGLARIMPVTTATWAIGVGALAGLPPLAGFFSKDGVLHAVWVEAPIAGAVLFAASALTALYAARATRLAFAGSFRGGGHPHESPAVMTGPLVVLATVALGLGAVSKWFAEALGGHAELSAPVAIVSTALALGAASVGWRVFAAGPAADERLAHGGGALWRAVSVGYGVDGAVAWVVNAGVRACRFLADRFERTVIDGAVTRVARASERVGREFVELQSGEGPLYAAFVAVAAMLMVGLALWLGR